MSSATDLVLAALRGSCSTGSHAWPVVNNATREALRLAITHRFRFERDDYAAIDRRGRLDDVEHYYSLACRYGNKSAAISIESHLGRKPWFVRLPGFWPSGRHYPGESSLNRMHVGCGFEWEGEDVTVTSFTESGGVIACSYHQAEPGEPAKVKRRFTITRDDVKAAVRALKNEPRERS